MDHVRGKKNVPLSEEELESVDGGTGIIPKKQTYTYAPSVCSKCGAPMMETIYASMCTKCGWTVKIVHNGPAFI